MARKSIGAEVQIMNLFATLSDEGRRIVSEWIRTQTAAPRAPRPKSVPAAGKRSSRKSGENVSTQNSKTDSDRVGTAPEKPKLFPLICVACGHEEDYVDHFQPSPNFHPFETKLKKQHKGASA